jgi:hypothetical protein
MIVAHRSFRRVLGSNEESSLRIPDTRSGFLKPDSLD